MKQLSVVIADDNQEWCAMLRDEIQRYPCFNILSCLYNGMDTIDYLMVHRPDIVILDIVMPIYDGLYVIHYIQERMVGYRPFIYVLSAIGTEKTNQIMRMLDVGYYSVKPIKVQAVAINLLNLLAAEHKLPFKEVRQLQLELPGQSLLVQDLDKYIEEYLFDLGVPLYKLSSKNTRVALMLLLTDKADLSNVTSLYKKVAQQYHSTTTPASIERNIRSTIHTIQKADGEYFRHCFPHGLHKLTNTEFLESSVILIRRRIKEQSGNSISMRRFRDAFLEESF